MRSYGYVFNQGFSHGEVEAQHTLMGTTWEPSTVAMIVLDRI